MNSYPLTKSACAHSNLRIACMEQTTQDYDTTKPRTEGWAGSQEPIGEFYTLGASCRDCGQEEFTPQELANLTGLDVFEHQVPPLVAQPE